MPKINIQIQKSIFRKKKYRSWDTNLLEEIKLDKNRVQKGSELEFKKSIKTLIIKLNGNEKLLFFFLLNICSKNRSLSTNNIPGKKIDKILNIPRNSRETSIKRLKRKGLLIRKYGKRGPNGTVNLSFSEIVKEEALRYVSMEKIDIYNIQNDKKEGSELGFNFFLNSSNINNKTTTTREEINKKKGLPEEWQKIDIEPLAQIGFSETQLKQLNGLNIPEIVQDSINHFAYGLEYNDKVKGYKEPLNVLMGILRKGQAWVENGYKLPQEIAQERFIERKKIERERIEKLKHEAYKIALEEWRDNISDKEIQKIVPLSDKSPAAIDSKLKLHFLTQVWPEIKKDYLFL